MRTFALWLLALAVLLPGAFAHAADAERLLVTVRYDAVSALHGDAVERYRRPHDYRTDVSLDHVLDALATDYALRRVGGWPMRALALHCEVFAVDAGASDAAIGRLEHDPRVDSVQKLNRFRTLSAPPAPMPQYRNLQHSLDELDVDRAHTLSLGRGVRVAVIDSGIDATHPDLRGGVEFARDFAGGGASAHGTEVAGVIGARHGLVGVAPEAELIDLRACWGESGQDGAVCDSFTLAQALDFAVTRGVDVINLSLSGPDDALLTRLLGAAEAKSITVVAAAPPRHDAAHAFPSAVASVIVVGVSEEPQAGLAVSAPGVDVLTTFPGGRYDYASGSSLAAANVSGVVALARALRHRLTPQQVRSVLSAHAPLSAATVLADVPAVN
jgi:subtilisin family serine protease